MIQRIAILTLIILLATALRAQHSPTMYYMYEVPQAHLLNPATQPRCGFYLGMPILSSFEVYMDNSSVSLGDVLIYEQSLDTLVTPFHSTQDPDEFFKNFKKRNSFTTELNIPWISFGFRIGDENYLNFHVMTRTMTDVFYPGDLTHLPAMEPGTTYDFSNFAVNTTLFNEYSVGLSRQIDRQLTVGFKLKFLSGIGNIDTRNTDITLTTSPEYATLNAKYEMYVNLPGLNIPIDGDSADFNEADFDDPAVNDFFSENIGFGLDMGFHYKVNERLTLSASLLDLGYISWKGNPYSIRGEANYQYEGALVDYTDSGWEFDEEDVDSLLSQIEPKASYGEPYNTFLHAKVYLGGQYFIGKRANISLLSRTEFNKGRLREQVTGAINVFPIKLLAASLSYTIANRTYNNIGLGCHWKLGPFSLHIIGDYFPAGRFYTDDDITDPLFGEPLPITTTARTFGFRVGMNLVFGSNRLKKQLQDKPLVL